MAVGVAYFFGVDAHKLGENEIRGGGRMVTVLTAAQMRAAEATAMAAGAVTGRILMERAGEGVVAAILSCWPELERGARRAVVLCGPGSNGGDGYVVARLLAGCGWSVEVKAFGTPEALRPDARENYDRWLEIGPVAPLTPCDDPDACDLVVDALFGTGLTRPLPDELCAMMLSYLPRSRASKVCAIDLPSGLGTDDGRLMPVAMMADLTVTFHRAKHGHYLGHGPEYCGRLVVADIGLTDQYRDALPLVTRPAVLLDKSNSGHKFSYGHALILSGGSGRTGAARLAARAALRVGAGLVTLGVPPAAQLEVAAQITAIMLHRVADAGGMIEALRDDRINALCLGPALGLAPEKAALIAVALDSKRPVVLDADALTLIAAEDDLRGRLHPDCVLTPHMGEFARLCPEISRDLTRGKISKPDAARGAARALNACLVLKGADSVIAAPDGRVALHAAAYDDAAPWLATAGSGDVLAGLITGILARGHPVFDAACTGVWLHAAAARQFGPGLIAEDLPEILPVVLRSLAV